MSDSNEPHAPTEAALPDPADPAIDGAPLEPPAEMEHAAHAAVAPRAADESIMAPEASPWRTQKFNRRPLIALALAVTGFGGLMGYAGLSRYAESNPDPLHTPAASDAATLPRGTDSKRMAEDIIGTPHVGLIPDADEPAPPTAAPAPDPPPAPVLQNISVADEPPRPPPHAQVDRDARTRSQTEDEEWRARRLAALREALGAQRTVHLERHTAGTESDKGNFVQRELARVAQQRAALNGPTDPATAYQQAAAQAAQILGLPPSAAHAPSEAGAAMMPNAAMMPGAPGLPAPPPVASSDTRNSLRGFASRSSDRWQLPAEVETPPSPYVLQAGSVIGAVLDSAVNSELPGPLLGHVAQNVYSSAGHHELIIPQGTALYGEYSADVVFGQDRLLVAWERLRFPNAKTLDIGAMPGTDGVGRVGFDDQVDHHYLRIFGSALLLSMVTAGVTMAQTPSAGSQDRFSAGSAMSQSLGLQFGQVTAQLLQKNLNIAPTIEIRNGFRFNIVVTKDIVFRGPYPEI